MPVHAIGVGKLSHAVPLRGMSHLEQGGALRLDLQCMKIEKIFRDLKRRLGLERQMNKPQEGVEKKKVTLLWLVYAIGLLVWKN